ncbi:MAG: DNA polymerase/3'-5' exonuclease PolX, partial [Chloroflexota bacterium]|nr:DNA polymerase/3'-5' exonuclease PolX [Chloroflexota bacterium]
PELSAADEADAPEPKDADSPDRSEADSQAPAPAEVVAVDPDEPPYEVRPRASRGDDVPLLGNDELARIFYEIGDMLELQGELPFKIAAYRRAADSIAHSPAQVAAAYRRGEAPALTGVGKAIADKLAELADTGRSRFYERLRRDVPPSLVTLLAVPGLGPRTAGDLWRALGITTLEELGTAARAGRLRSVRGISERTEKKILDGLEQLRKRPPRRMRLGQASEILERLALLLGGVPGVRSVVPAGSYRRRRETIGDLDLLVETDHGRALIETLHASPAVEQVGGHGGRLGQLRTTVQLLRGPQLDVMTMPVGATGTYLVHFTGSAEHNVRLRELARDRGWSLSEHGFTRLDEDGETLAGEGAERRTFATESEVYDFLGLPFIEPELREDRGESEAAREGRLPQLVDVSDLQGDCHTHSDWSDGSKPIDVWAEAARRRGYAYQVLTDHSHSLTIANGLDPRRVEQQRRIIGELNERFAREEASGSVPQGAHPSGFRLLHGCEMEIRTDGRLDYDDALLARFDVVVASLHVGRRQPRTQLMERYFTALRSPHVDIIAHPSGRKIGIRDDLDLDWDVFYRTAAETGTLLEINGSDERLDLDDRRIRAALEAGCTFTVDSDAHYMSEWDNVIWGIGLARRGWLEKRHVANTLPRDEFLTLIADKPHRVS